MFDSVSQGNAQRLAHWSVLLTPLFLISLFAETTPAQVDKTIKIQIELSPQQKPQIDQEAPFEGERASVEVAILLDTSNSMDGLISQAKSQLWTIVQQFAEAKKNGNTPTLRVAVFEYGNSGLPASENYIRQAVGLTDDMDRVSEVLFALTTNGGDEYCGAMVGEAVKRLDWSKAANSYKAIFIAGNEPFTQGPIDYKETCKQAIQSGIVVNTIHCGDRNAGVNGEWEAGARLAEGKFLNINQDKQVIQIDCPQDRILIELSTELNGTYLWYGAKDTRESLRSNQVQQDENAMRQGNAGGRGKTKGSKAYSNNGRDLIDTYVADAEILSKVKAEDLPELMQAMTAEERLEHLKKMLAKRDEIKTKIQSISAERDKYIAEEMAKRGESEDDTLGGVMREMVSDQLESAGFEIDK